MNSKGLSKGFTLVELLMSLSVITIILLIASFLFVTTINSDRTFNLEHEKILANYNLTKMLKHYLTYMNTDKISTTTLGNDLVFYYKEVIPSLQTIEIYHWLYPREEDNKISFYSTTTSVDDTPTDYIDKWVKITFPINLDIRIFTATPIGKDLEFQAVIGMTNSVTYLDISLATSTIKGIVHPPLR